jgi:hypothetical protein
MLKRAVAIIQYTDTIPQFRLLLIVSHVKRLRLEADLPLDQKDDTRPVGRQSRLAGDHPSSSNNDLRES